MEGLIPYIYRAIVQSKNGGCTGTVPRGSWFNESPSAAYMQLPGDSGRFTSDIPLLMPDFSSSSSASSATATAVETPARHPQLHRMLPGYGEVVYMGESRQKLG